MTDFPEQLLHDLVATPSPTGETEKAVRVFTDHLKARGFDAFRDDAGNAVAVAGRGEREILLVGHIDTVPGDLPVRVTDDGYLTGRGSVDAKGPLAAFACAAEKFLDDERFRIVVVGACDEEGESHGARHLLDRYAPEALVIGEPSGLTGVTIGYKGIMRMQWTLEDDLDHGGTPYASVPDRGVAFWRAVQAYCDAHAGATLFDSLTAKLQAFNTTLLPSGRHRATLTASARIPPACDVDAFRAHLEARAGGGELEVTEAWPAYLADKNSPLSRAFVHGVRAERQRPRFVRKTGTSDMNVLVGSPAETAPDGSGTAHAWECPAVAYGPGDSRLDHTPHERVHLDEYRTAIRILEHALERIAADGA